MNPLVILELILRIVLTAMEGQPPEVRKQLWEWYVQDLSRWRRWLQLDRDSDPSDSAPQDPQAEAGGQ